jgi:guanidinoacetate N-methyltransferase
MTRRLKRLREFDITLQIKDDGFITPPQPSQRNWLLNKALTEFAADLKAQDELASRFVPGSASDPSAVDRQHGDLSDEQIMEDWQIPLMEAMAEIVTETHGDVLEVGFGRGVSADLIQAGGVRSHTIVECNETIVGRYEEWREKYPGRDVRLIQGRWQDTIDQLALYDGIFFHTYPLTEEEYLAEAVNSVTFAAHFFPTAAQHLRTGGIFTYLTHEIDSLSRPQQRLLFQYFNEFSLRPVALNVPPNTKDAWWADSMVVIKAVK